MLWCVVSEKFRCNLMHYNNIWKFAAALTNYHITLHPLRNFEDGVDMEDEYEYEEEEEIKEQEINEEEEEA